MIGDTQPVGLSGDKGRYQDLKCDVEPFYVAQNENEANLVESQAPNSLQHLVHCQRHLVKKKKDDITDPSNRQ